MRTRSTTITMITIVPIPMYMAWFLPSCLLTGPADLWGLTWRRAERSVREKDLSAEHVAVSAAHARASGYPRRPARNTAIVAGTGSRGHRTRSSRPGPAAAAGSRRGHAGVGSHPGTPAAARHEGGQR